MAARRTRGTGILAAALRRHALPADRLELRRITAGESLPVASTRFGGDPYAEADDSWPVDPKTREPLEFVFQLHPRDLPHHPRPDLGLICVYAARRVVRDGFPDEGELIARVYRCAREESHVSLRRPPSQSAPPDGVAPCRVQATEVMTVPDLEALRDLEPETVRGVEDTRAWGSPGGVWRAAVGTLGKEYTADGSRVGGWPDGIQGTIPREIFLGQIACEDAAGLEWGDSGNCYVLLDPLHPDRVEFDVQGY